jgi:hypothetical protein
LRAIYVPFPFQALKHDRKSAGKIWGEEKSVLPSEKR